MSMSRNTGYAQAMLTKSEIQRQAFDPAAEEHIELVVELWNNLVPGEIPARDGPQCPISPPSKTRNTV